MGAFFTLMTSPIFTVREGFSVVLPEVTLPFLQASAAMVRVLKMRAAQSHLSRRADSCCFSCLSSNVISCCIGSL